MDFRNARREPDFTAVDVENHLNALAGQDGWSAGDDFALVAALRRGSGLTGAMAATGRSRADCLARWRALCPPELDGLDLQAMVFAEVKRRLLEAQA